MNGSYAKCIDVDFEVALLLKEQLPNITPEQCREIQIAWDSRVCDNYANWLKARDPQFYEKAYANLTDKDFRMIFEQHLLKAEMNWYTENGRWTVPLECEKEEEKEEYWPPAFKNLEINLHDLQVTEEVLTRLGEDINNRMTCGLLIRDSMMRAVYKDCAHAIKNLQQHFE